MREKMQGIIAAIIVGLLCVTFALWGVQYYLHSGSGDNQAASVNGAKITKQQFGIAYRRAYQQLMINSKGKLTLTQEQQKILHAKVLQQMVNKLALFQAASKMGFDVGMEQVDAILSGMPVFQIAGRFSEQRFQQVLERMLYSEAEFMQDIRKDVITQQLRAGIAMSDFSTKYEAKNAVRLLEQKRDVDYLLLPLNNFKHKVTVTPAEIKAYYTTHEAKFTLPEKVAIQYLELKQSELKLPSSPTNSALHQFYDSNIDLYSHPDRWHISKIFVRFPANATHDDKKVAETKIEKLYKEAKTGINFDKLDINYGHPIWAIKQQLSADVLKALSTMKAGNISKPIMLDNGFVIVKLLKKEKAQTLSFTAAKNRVLKAYVQHKLTELFDQKNDALSDLTYTNSDTLRPAAKKLNLKIKTTDFFTKKGGKSGIIKDSKIVTAAFGSAILRDNYNSDPIEVAPGDIVVLRKLKYAPQKLLPLSKVQNEISDRLLVKKELVAAIKSGKKLQQSGSDLASLSQQEKTPIRQIRDLTLSNASSKHLDPILVQKIFSLPNEAKQQLFGIALPTKGYAIIKLRDVKFGSYAKLSQTKQDIILKQMARSNGELLYDLFLQDIVGNAKVISSPGQSLPRT